MSTPPQIPFILPSNDNDSATGGALVPTGTDGDLNDKNLVRFLQQWIVAVTGLPAPMVRPRWQPEPPNVPDQGTDWAAVGSIRRTRDTFAFQGEKFVNGVRTFYVNRQEILEVLLSNYGPNAEQFAELFAMGIQLSQNREILTLNNMGLVESEESQIVPAQINERWMYGVDTKFRIRRSQKYTYAVQDITAAGIILYTDIPSAAYPINVSQPG